MELKNCEYCGTAFDARLSQCPLCGRASGAKKADVPPAPAQSAPVSAPADDAPQPQPGRARRLSGGARLSGGYSGKRVRTGAKPASSARSDAPEAPRGNVYGIPKGMMIALCVILGIAVLGGALLAFSRLGWSPLYRDVSLQEPVSPAPAEQPAAQPETPQTPVTPAASETQSPESRYVNEEDQRPAETADTPAETDTVACTSLTLSAPTVTFEEEGRFFNITFTRRPEGCTEPVTFASSDETVATVSAQGKIVAVNAGSAVITATCGAQSATCLVTCDFAYVGGEETGETFALALSRDDLTFFSAGEQYQLTVSGAPEGAVIVYAIGDESVATVSQSGVLTAKGSGTTTVTVTVDSNDPLSCIVRCNFKDGAQDDTCTLSNSDVTMGLKGETFQISLCDANGNKITGLLWVSSDLSVCSVDGTGVVKAEGKGTAYISTTYNGVSYQCIVRCNL